MLVQEAISQIKYKFGNDLLFVNYSDVANFARSLPHNGYDCGFEEKLPLIVYFGNDVLIVTQSSILVAELKGV